MLLPCTSAHAAIALAPIETQLHEQRHVLSEVQAVLSEMVYDVETCAHEEETTRLRRELAAAHAALAEHQQRERELVLERQKAYDFAEKVEAQGREAAGRLRAHVGVLVVELAKKEILESELVHARQQNELTAQLSKELASAQRDIRELHRTTRVQSLLRGVNSRLLVGSSTLAAVGARPAPPKDHAALASAAASSPVSPSSTSSRSSTSSTPAPVSGVGNKSPPPTESLARCPDQLLMRVFAFLDANSVFAVSLANHSLLARSEKEKAQWQLSKVELIVKSLKKDEIKIFHELSTRVKALETHLAHVQAEKEDVVARLHGAENVRAFLTDKLKDLEDELATALDASAKKDEQAALDREIIGFLDARTQEYELLLKKCVQQNDEYRAELVRLEEAHAAKTSIMQDMVQLLTHEKQDLDVQLRSQRKVLVREVKVLRAQNQQLSSEKDQYFVQLKQLKHALRHLDAL
ncbi:hypothetical protein PybrP1_007172 [[Pythium] brassicae (nom. inval.)]|nr:hypothetical protein PybrP1_007172 [[Pythium] brassicae (nom. inval.)]